MHRLYSCEDSRFYVGEKYFKEKTFMNCREMSSGQADAGGWQIPGGAGAPAPVDNSGRQQPGRARLMALTGAAVRPEWSHWPPVEPQFQSQCCQIEQRARATKREIEDNDLPPLFSDFRQYYKLLMMMVRVSTIGLMVVAAAAMVASAAAATMSAGCISSWKRNSACLRMTFPFADVGSGLSMPASRKKMQRLAMRE